MAPQSHDDDLKETPSQTAGPFVHIGTYPSAAGLPVRTQEKPNVLASASSTNPFLLASCWDA